MTDNETTRSADEDHGDPLGGARAMPSPAQQAAARGAYEDVQASTGGDSRTSGGETSMAPPVTADPVEEQEDTVTAEPGEDNIAEGDSLAGLSGDGVAVEESSDARLAAERLVDLQRLQAEYVNYKRRVDRDRAVESERAIAGVIEALLPVMDEIHLARQHGELETGPFAKIAEKFETILGRYGVERYGEPGETFDPTVHEAVMHVQAELAPGTTDTTVVQIMQPGYRLGERVVRPALVSVADPL
ncbi:Protein GrpE [Austwickia sp. TVS 96-490-7B]|uniref:nucleotide exchange factor GrpE n=1 Tax=Austwickia sp. TVS 96-490-7B TaxID=2830843 RepID=UPI001DEE588F|nr:nucleotide exchange factor GrpE [Austwickia sp. TVS 96-490-7B]MBW3085060.1 Protein GrpE [Austwickia sp. TVS 96-490-7B]